MEDNFRNVLIILSAIVIIAIFVHGLWTIRKAKNPYKLKTTKDKISPLTRDFDRSGFDQDGVSQVKVSKADTQTIDSHDISEQTAASFKNKESMLERSQRINLEDTVSPATAFDTQEIKSADIEEQKNGTSLDSLDDTLEPDWFNDESEKNSVKSIKGEDTLLGTSSFTKDELGDELTLTSEPFPESSEAQMPEPEKAPPIEPLYEQPVTQAKPTRKPIKRAKKTLSKAELKRDQIEIDFDNQVEEKQLDSTNDDQKNKSSDLAPQVIILSVVMPTNQQMFGAALLPSLLTLGLKYGEMNIFHRHEDNAGNGKVTFSLANILNPGTFDLDSMENFATKGVSLFMTLPNAGDSFAVFEQMLNAAKQLAQEFNAQVLDDKRNILTKQSEQHYFNMIREFDRKRRISLVQ